jgi:hypothetical protein
MAPPDAGTGSGREVACHARVTPNDGMDGMDDIDGVEGMERELPATPEQDEDLVERMALQAEIQAVLDELARTMPGDSMQDVTVAINRGLADAGIPEQPHRWVESMAERIRAGRPPVADTKGAVDAIRHAETDG